MPLWIWPLYHKHNATFVSLLTLGNIYPFRCWRTLRHFFIAVQMRSNCGRTMHIRCSLFRPSILFLSLFIANFSLRVWFIAWIFRSFSRESLSHQKFPFVKMFSSLLNFTISVCIILKFSDTQKNTAWFSFNFPFYLMPVSNPEKFPHACVTYLFHSLFSYKHLHNVELFDDCERTSERASLRWANILLPFYWQSKITRRAQERDCSLWVYKRTIIKQKLFIFVPLLLGCVYLLAAASQKRERDRFQRTLCLLLCRNLECLLL